LDRSGPAPSETLAGRPLHPWTLPNAIGFARLALIPVFLVVAYRTHDGHTALGAAIFLAIAVSDYLDGIAARLTRQYSRLGTLLDPLVDRALVVAGLAVCWSYGLLPRWALAALARLAIARGMELRINWFGRLGVWWTMAAPFWAIASVDLIARVALYIGLAMSLVATWMYVRAGLRELRVQARAQGSS